MVEMPRIDREKCDNCGLVSFPWRRICHDCGEQDRSTPVKLKKSGRVFTYTHDYIYMNPDPPEILAAVDLDGGGRFFGQVADVAPEKMHIGMNVTLSFRKLHDAQNFPNYFWKAIPAGKDV